MKQKNQMMHNLRVQYSAIAFACTTLTALAIANDGVSKSSKVPTASALEQSKALASAPLAINTPSAKNNQALVRVAPPPGFARADLSAIGLGGIAIPSLTAENTKNWKVGDSILVATPDGATLDFTVSNRAWTGADEQQIYLAQGDTGSSLYGIVSQIGSGLTGYFLRRDGVAYGLSLVADGQYKLTLRPNYGVNECGVGRDLPQYPGAGADSKAGALVVPNEGGIAGGAVTPCPPEVAPIGLPPGLLNDNGTIIDVLIVYSVDANELLLADGTTPYEQAVLTVAQVNLSMQNSSDQPVTDFDGQDPFDNELNLVCFYGAYPEPGTTGLSSPTSCTDDLINIAFHEARPGVTPAEKDVCTPRIRLVGALVADGNFGEEEPFVSTGFAVDLSRLIIPGDGYLDYVLDWRDALGADEVALVGVNYGSDSGFVGLATVMSDANNLGQALSGLSIPGNPHPIVDATIVGAVGGILGPSSVSTLQAFSESPFCLLDITVLGDTVYAHELGHNLGCQHNQDAPSAEPGDALFPDSFGFGDENFRTVMAYPAAGNVRLPGFSNPNKRWVDYDGPNDATQDAGEAFDFDCQDMDEIDGSDAEYIEETGVQGPGADALCTTTDDNDPNPSAAMVIATDARIEDNALDKANNARSISQVKFDFAKFRCSIFPIVDCNDNEIDDYLEAVDGVSDDCNADGVPDVCQVAVEGPGIPSPNDCNQNEIPDTCDITNGTSQDVNVNGVPDECEDQTLLFRESFELIPYGVISAGELPIAKVGTLALAELRKLDPTFPAYFASISTTDQNADTVTSGVIYTDNIPSLFQYGLGQNGSVAQWNGILGQGFATAFGSKGYGQRLDFDSLTGYFRSATTVDPITGEIVITAESGVTTITLARNTKEARFYMNAMDFTNYFDTEEAFPGTYPSLVDFPFLQANIITVEAFLDDQPIFWQTYDMRAIQTPTYATGFASTTQEGGPVRIGQTLGQDPDPAFVFNRIVISGAFVVIDNVSFDLGQAFADCPADIAGGVPEGGLPTPDGRIGADDLVLVLALFGLDAAGNPIATIADINSDGIVNAMDLLEVLSTWGNCPGGIGG